LPWGFWVLQLPLAGWVQQALLNFAPQHSLLLAYATPANVVVNYHILGPTHLQHSLHIPNFLPTSGFAMWALRIYIFAPPGTAVAEGVYYSMSRRGHSIT
jgi:hypothetical protein